MIPKFVRKKFAGVQQPLGRWILRHVAEFIVLSPAILVIWLWLKACRKEVFLTGVASSSITAFLMPLEPELRRRVDIESGLRRLIVLDLSPDANSQIRKMYDRVVKIYGEEAKLSRRIVWWASALGKLQIPKVDILDSQNDPLWHTGQPLVRLTKAEIEAGNKFLESIGVGKHQPIVCYATRSSSYYEKLSASGVQLKPRNIRNPVESIYFEVAKYLCEQGLFVIRMGKDLDSKVPDSHKKYISDYASEFRTDFLDVFLLYRCTFLLNGATGIGLMRAIFNFPTIYSDFYRNHNNFFKGDLASFQKVFYVSKNRYATVSEMVSMNDQYSDERHQDALGVALVKNTVEEILESCNEMTARLNGTWVTTDQDEVLQKKYWELISTSGHHGGRIGAQFLRDNQDLLR